MSDSADDRVAGWPTCNAAITLLGVDLTCVLPKHHERDGAATHLDHASRTQWSLVLKMKDGTERRL